MGRAIREFKKASNEVRDTVVNASSTDTPPAPPPAAVPPPAPNVPPAATPPKSEVSEEPKAQV
jgi:Sec-independent protein translocase protein TatA